MKKMPKHTQKASTGGVEHRPPILLPLQNPQKRRFGHAIATKGAPYSRPVRRAETVEACWFRSVAGGTHSQMHLPASAGGGDS